MESWLKSDAFTFISTILVAETEGHVYEAYIMRLDADNHADERFIVYTRRANGFSRSLKMSPDSYTCDPATLRFQRIILYKGSNRVYQNEIERNKRINESTP